MSWIDASAVVALVSDDNACNGFQLQAVCFTEGDPMCLKQLTATVNDAVAIPTLEASPVNAVVQFQLRQLKVPCDRLHGNWRGNQFLGATLVMQEKS